MRIMHYSWWLLGLREKGLCSISVFEASTLPLERKRTTEREKERKRDKGEWLFLREGARKRLREDVGIREKEEAVKKGERTGWLAISKWIPFRRRPPSSLSLSLSIHHVTSLRSSSFLSSHKTRRVDQLRSCRLLRVTEKERRREGARNERNAAELDGKAIADRVFPD